MKKYAFVLMLLVIIITPSIATDAIVQKISDKVIMVTPPKENLELFGWPNSIINTIAIDTEGGIIFIDTQNCPKNMHIVKDAVFETFGHNKVAYVINTHGHSCHTGGNCIFTGTEIVAHINCAEEISNFDWIFMGETLEFLRNKIADLTVMKDSIMHNDSIRMDSLNHKIELYSEFEKDFITNYRTRYPDITFEGNYTLNPGGTKIDLIYMGKGHSESDLVVHIPSEKVLYTGNLFHFGVNEYTNFPTFYPRRRNDIESWINGLSQIMKLKNDIEYVIPTHVDKPLKFELIEFTNQYIQTMWKEVKAHPKATVLELANTESFKKLFDKYKNDITINSYAKTYHKGNIAIIQREIRMMKEDLENKSKEKTKTLKN